uniref:ATP synthase complex subunit 8 n=1 Tax=Creobroter sp. JZ-2017 TaxID=2073091 RepID=A0A343UNB4_9NEOP|nr:ATP synthase F0 subunit 8 [Creobroter sp. JZ-2017]
MPQMMPLNWLTLFLFFSMMLILFNVLNYYSPFNKKSSSLSIKTTTKNLTWKW